ncbi:hypothetical protein LOTGIDRAFT_162126 [Lottia gigantea]|uniref:Vesicular, overexpressed in cancer, prosurvival protein 1 n=1 Tax=Lottia gigantea TaxID=225164 RepID=V3ZNZ3_LOTGI|nr:hypothetical protein LOTGIDRAFT_162126 [Lottia gigantea]ESO93103.1 hypothetical protein LOTGIDRAFT_162126 [Lottia gigantea]
MNNGEMNKTVHRWRAQELCVETKIWCEDGYCCNDGKCCLYYHETWWFWLIWGIIFLILSCCFYHRDRICRCCRSSRNRNSTLVGTVSHPYHHIVSTTSSSNIPFCDPNVRLPSYDEVPIIPKNPPPEYNQVCCSPVLPETSLQRPNICDDIEERDWETPMGTPPPPYSPLHEQ